MLPVWPQTGSMQDSLSRSDRERMARSGMRPLSGDEGMALFDAALHAPEPAPAAVRFDFRALRGRAAQAGVPALLRALVRPARRAAHQPAAADTAESYAERLAALPEEQRRTALLDLIAEQTATVLGLAGPDQVEHDQAFKDLGFDSLTSVELRNTIAARAGVRLPATLVFDHPTPTALARHLHQVLLPDPGTQDPGMQDRGTRDPGARTPGDATAVTTASAGTALDAEKTEALIRAEAELIAGMDVESLVARAMSGSDN